MKVVICGSVNFPGKMKEIAAGLKARGHEVVLPYSIIKHDLKCFEDTEKLKGSKDYIAKTKPFFTRRHFDEIGKGGAILVVNVEKHGIPNYIGGATFAEMVFAFYLKKKIFLLNPIPTNEKLAFFRDEIEATKPVVINGDLGLVK